ncbi:MAG: class I SAM-dependent methyltransferase, partial [bacterium]
DLDFPEEPQIGPYECRKHKKICTPVQEAAKFLKRYTPDTFRRIEMFKQLRKDVAIAAICGDSRTIGFPPADLVITSPPYVGLIDYHEQHRYAYELLSLLPAPFESVGYEDRDGRKGEAQEIGPASEGRSERARQEYEEGIRATFANVIGALPVGAHLVIIVNDKYGIYDRVAASLPVETVTILNRHVNRRTGRRNSKFYESVLIWRKTD